MKHLLDIGCIWEKLAIGVHDEAITGPIENDPSTRPFLVLRVRQYDTDGRRMLCQLPFPPSCPNRNVAVWVGQAISVFLRVAQGAAVRQEMQHSAVVAQEPEDAKPGLRSRVSHAHPVRLPDFRIWSPQAGTL